MLFSVHALDNPDSATKRQAVHAEHVVHLKSAKDQGVTIVVGGPLVDDDGTLPPVIFYDLALFQFAKARSAVKD